MGKNVLGSSNTYTGGSGITVFSINLAIGTISVDQIKVYLDGSLQTNIVDYVIDVGISTVTFVTAPSSGVIIDIRREQDDNTLETDYQDLQQIKEVDLDKANKGLYYLIHELFDGWIGNRFKLRADLDANNKKIVNLAPPINGLDAVNYNTVLDILATKQVVTDLSDTTYVLLDGNHATYTSDNITYDMSPALTTDIDSALIYIQGVKQIAGIAYTITASSADIVFTEALSDEDQIEFYITEVL